MLRVIYFLSFFSICFYTSKSYSQPSQFNFEDLILQDTNLFSKQKNALIEEIEDSNYPDSLKIESYFELARLYSQNNLLKKAEAIFDTIDNKFAVSKLEQKLDILRRKSSIYTDAGKYNSSVKVQLEILKYYELEGDLKNVTVCYLDIADLFIDAKDYSNAFYYASIAKTTTKDENFVELQARAHFVLGTLYLLSKEYQKSEELYLKAINLAKSCNCVEVIASVYNDLATLYLEQLSFYKAIEYLNEAIALNEKNNNKEWLVNNYYNLAKAYKYTGYMYKSLDYYKKNLHLRDSLNLPDMFISSYSSIADIYSQIGDFKNAFYYFRRYEMIKDSLSELEDKEMAMRLAIQFQSNKREAELERLKIQDKMYQEEIHYKNKLNFFLTLFVLIVTIAIVFLWVSVKKRNKANLDLVHKNQRIDEQHKEIIDSINYAKRIQHSILPSNQALNSTLPNNALLYLPKDIVSGDFYICEKINNMVYFGVADCTGHGVPGAMVSLVASSVLNKCLHELKLTDTNQILDHLNIEVPQVLASENEDIHDGMDISLCRLNLDSLQLQFSGAYLNCWVFNQTQTFLERIPKNMSFSGKNGLNILEIKGNRMGIGKSSVKSNFSAVNFQLQKGDKIMLSSDGFEDQFGGPKNKKFKLNQLRNLIFRHGQQEVQVILKELNNSFVNWMGDKEQVDDVCLMIVEI